MRTWKLFVPILEQEKSNFSFSNEELSEHFQLVGEEEAEFFLFPIFYEVLYEYSPAELSQRNISSLQVERYREALKSLESTSGRLGKKILVFYYRDPISPLPIQNAIVFRTSLVKSSSRVNEYALPAFVQDMQDVWKSQNQSFYLNKPIKPTIGFCGLSAPMKLPLKTSLRIKASRILKGMGAGDWIQTHYNFGYLARREAMLACQKSPLLITDFIANNTDTTHYRERFLKNMYENMYTICVSGHGNYSYRLYETLSSGRIPIFVDTDSVLPFEEQVDWRKYVIWVNEGDINKMPKIIADFHASHSSDELLAFQSKNREFWESYLSRDGFLKHLTQPFTIHN